MVDLRVKIEQVETRNKLVKLVDYINSSEFYKLSENNRKMLQNRKACLEMYLSTLNMEVYEDVDSIFVPDMAAVGLMSSVFGGFPKMQPLRETIDEIEG